MHCSGTSPGHIAAPLRRRRLPNAFRALLLCFFAGVEDGTSRCIQCRRGSATRKLFTSHPVSARQHDKIVSRPRRGSNSMTAQEHLFSFAFKQRARGNVLLQRATWTTDQIVMALSRGETKPHQTAERRVIFLLSGRIYSAARRTWLQSKIATAQGITPLCRCQ